jgi:hypothetical protein
MCLEKMDHHPVSGFLTMKSSSIGDQRFKLFTFVSSIAVTNGIVQSLVLMEIAHKVTPEIHASSQIVQNTFVQFQCESSTAG